MSFMWYIKNNRLIDFLWVNGLKPTYELYGIAFYEKNKQLYSLLDKYYVEYALIPNRF